MSDQTVPYTSDTWVWAKVLKRIWWPGKIVDLSSIPEEVLKDFHGTTKNNAKTAVFFENDESYEIITNLANVVPYSCAKKLDFVEKGYLIYLRQLKGSYVNIGGIDMKNFIEDVKNIEKNIQGDINIFEQFNKVKQTKGKKTKSKVIVDNCSNVNNVQLENIDTKNKVDAGLGLNIVNVLSSLPVPPSLENMFSKDELINDSFQIDLSMRLPVCFPINTQNDNNIFIFITEIKDLKTHEL